MPVEALPRPGAKAADWWPGPWIQWHPIVPARSIRGGKSPLTWPDPGAISYPDRGGHPEVVRPVDLLARLGEVGYHAPSLLQ